MPHKDPAERRAYIRRYKKLHPEKFGRDYDRVNHANQRAKAYGILERITIADVRAVKATGVCFYCGASEGHGLIKDLGIDHRIPFRAGGSNTRENIVACCHPCNCSKHAGDIPWRWSRVYDKCQRCGTNERKHVARGFCNACYLALFGNKRRGSARNSHRHGDIVGVAVDSLQAGANG